MLWLGSRVPGSIRIEYKRSVFLGRGFIGISPRRKDEVLKEESFLPYPKKTSSPLPIYRANFKTPPFARSLRQAQILILEISNIFLWLKFSPFLISIKIEHFESGSTGCFLTRIALFLAPWDIQALPFFSPPPSLCSDCSILKGDHNSSPDRNKWRAALRFRSIDQPHLWESSLWGLRQRGLK